MIFRSYGTLKVLKSYSQYFKSNIQNCSCSLLYTSSILSKQSQLRRSNKFRKPASTSVKEDNDEICEDEESNIDLEIGEMKYQEMVQESFQMPLYGHNVYVIQPYVKWGPMKKKNTTPTLQLEEAVTLIKTLKNWKVIEQEVISLDSLKKFTLFGKGNLNKIKNNISSNKEISAIFISVDLLKGAQRKFFEAEFNVQCYDRYNIVMQIFREHAVTREAKLQIQMAEMPYLYSRLKDVEEQHNNMSNGILRGGRESFHESRQRVLKLKETKIKNELIKLKEHRNLMRKNRRKLEYPVIAIVGYTNCGKTSLIKALTGAKKLEPKNELFATLDVTVHSGLLPSFLEVLYVDTIGFISDIPTNLIESFIATLEDAMFADVIVHVLDVSHPNLKAQIAEVNRTLESLNLPQDVMKNIIHVGNKIDLVDSEHLNKIKDMLSDIIFVSADKLVSTDYLRENLEKVVLEVTGRQVLVIRVRSGGTEYKWLYREANITSVNVDKNDSQYVFVRVIITQVKLAQFKNIFIKNFNL